MSGGTIAVLLSVITALLTANVGLLAFIGITISRRVGELERWAKEHEALVEQRHYENGRKLAAIETTLRERSHIFLSERDKEGC